MATEWLPREGTPAPWLLSARLGPVDVAAEHDPEGALADGVAEPAGAALQVREGELDGEVRQALGRRPQDP